MGLARELTMGTKRNTRTKIGFDGDYATVRRLIKVANPDISELRAALERISESPTRLRYAEGVVYLNGCARYREITGDNFGPSWGTY